MRVGAASGVIEVPLFTELYGYGPFLGRRNRGVHDPLRCRAGSFFDGKRRVIVISNDLVTMSRSAARAVRAGIYSQTGTDPAGIMVCGSHTHSGPTISRGIGWGELNVEFREYWIRQAVARGIEAINDEEDVTMAGGISPLLEKLGTNRVKENGPTDPDIRWVKFKRGDGGVKLLVHNHGMHGVVFGTVPLVSADWIGAANTLAVERRLAENVIFLQGAEGNVNTEPCCLNLEKGLPHLKRISQSYIASLQAGFAAEKAMPRESVAFVCRDFRLPAKPADPASLRRNAAALRAAQDGKNSYLADRFEEMALYMEAGNSIDVHADLQVLRIGDLFVYAMPGEPFVEIGMELMRKSPGFPMVAGIANGNCRYFPTRETFERFPSITSPRSYGFYEIHQGCGRFMPEYDDDIAAFMIGRMLELAAEVA
ncbi:MAG: hypothetical protein GX608_13745 [Lentisphaerae bacterium]|nr:hypothetical protein [Lentisphaerota bacterium]